MGQTNFVFFTQSKYILTSSDQLQIATNKLASLCRLSIMLNYRYLISWSSEKTFPGGWVVGFAENKASSAPIELGLGLSLAMTCGMITDLMIKSDAVKCCTIFLNIAQSC